MALPTSLNRYKVYCVEEDKYVNTWSTNVPTECPAPINHSDRSIDHSKTVIDQTISENYVSASDRSTGNMQLSSYVTDVPSGSIGDVHTQDYTWDTDIMIWKVNIHSHYPTEDDILNVIAAPDTVIGVNIEDIGVSTTNIPVSPTVLENIQIGFNVSISDGTNVNDLGIVQTIDQTNKQIIVSVATTNPFNIGSAILMNRFLLKEYILPSIIHSSGHIQFMDKGLTGLEIPRGVILRVKYTNNTTSSKKLYWHMEYFMK